MRRDRSMQTKQLILPCKEQELENLTAGDRVCLTGVIYTARDAAHKRLYDLIMKNQPLPIDTANLAIYYAGPCPPKPGYVIGSAGPTTSSRMDVYTPPLLDRGLKVMIGKGNRSPEVIQSMIKNKAVYFAATGGAGALICKSIKSCRPVAFEDLGPEAIYRLEVENFCVITAIDAHGNNLYERNRR
jgi:fumarate hydratase subunit beta